jgi:PadR family transcriptional regulator
MAKEPRHSHQALRVLRLFIENPGGELSGAQISKQLGIASGSLYPILFRYEEAGWLRSQWEEIDPTKASRPRRRYYRLGDVGQRRATELIEEVTPTFARGPQWVTG